MEDKERGGVLERESVCVCVVFEREENVDEEGHSSLSDLLTSRNSYTNITLIELNCVLATVFTCKMANNTFIIAISLPIQFKPVLKCWYMFFLSVSYDITKQVKQCFYSVSVYIRFSFLNIIKKLTMHWLMVFIFGFIHFFGSLDLFINHLNDAKVNLCI